MNAYLALGLAIVAEVIATTALKASDSFTRLGPSVLALLGMGLIIASVVVINLFSKSAAP